jgi:voltage-gated potassium channel
MTLRLRIFNLIEMQGPARLSARLVNLAIMLLIVVNVIAVMLESVDAYRQAYGPWFWWLEAISVGIFTVEYLLRLWVSVEHSAYGAGWRGRVRYALSPMALIDLLAILPFYLSAFFAIDTRILRVLRLLRVFKLTRHFAVLEVLATVLRNEGKTLISAIFVMIILVILASAGIYAIERIAQPEAFGSIPRAMWWATVTLTTVGYGDVVPQTLGGRLLGVVITVLGVGMAALPAGIIASGFTSELARRREAYELKARELLSDGEITSQDRRELIKTRTDLGLERNDAQQLLRKAALELQEPALASTGPFCPHCGKSLQGKADD